VKNYNDVQVGDHIEVFERTERARACDRRSATRWL
jgi:hypothetical protein